MLKERAAVPAAWEEEAEPVKRKAAMRQSVYVGKGPRRAPLASAALGVNMNKPVVYL
ncbi:MAG: hypothetical protein P4L40_14520 [Terracidiphilus sp.]|nr:hypothetical protein [Terracidiphilus sp.]